MSATGGALAEKRVLVTGASGFIGSRLVERLVLEERARVRALVHHPAKAVRIARLPTEMVHGDLLDRACVENAATGCDAVFHCAYGSAGDEAQQRRVNVNGTRNVLDACRRARVERLIHFSTLMVYGATGDGDLDEDAPRRYFGNVYSDSKLDAERLVFEYVRHRRLPAVILQPTAVYGPFAVQWTQQILERLKTGRLILIDGGEGLRNAVYVDDLVSAALHASVKQEAIGEAFLISGDAPVTWREFYRAFESMLGLSDRLVSLSAAEAETLYRKAKEARGFVTEIRALAADYPDVQRRLLKSRELAFMTKTLRGWVSSRWRDRLKSRIAATGKSVQAASAESPPNSRLHLLDPATIRFQASRTTVRIDKARRLLGYRPAFDFCRGMELTERWARWANLLEPAEPVLAAVGVQGSPFKVQCSEISDCAGAAHR